MSAHWHSAPMDDLAMGRVLRALRHRLRLRQIDIAVRANVSQSLVSRIERGRLDEMARGTIRRVFATLDADVVTVVRWRGGQLDRLLDERHADIVGRVAALLRREGWVVIPEATFSEFGERGSIDLLAWHPATRTLLVVEIKTEIASAEEMLRRHDVKVRLAPKVALERFGERPAVVARLLVIADSSTNRRRLDRLEPVVGAAYPARGGEVRRWLRSPAGAIAGAIFVSGSRNVPPGSGGPARVRRSRASRRD
jgi:HTH-type transcriptional regulator/antitoxin HipB